MSGYTLLELLIVLAVTGLVAALAAPLAGRAVASATLDADARSLASFLRAQQLLARTGQHDVAIDTDAVPILLQTAGLSPQAQVSVAGDPLEYFPDGTASGGQVVLREYGRAKSIDVAWLTGKITIGDAP